jgi:hypothetical protein
MMPATWRQRICSSVEKSVMAGERGFGVTLIVLLCLRADLRAAETDSRSKEAAEFLTEFVGRLQPL